MRFFDILSLSFHNVKRYKSRGLFACVSVAIGVLSVTIIVSIGETAKDAIQSELNSMGMNGIMVYQSEMSPGESYLAQNHTEELLSKVPSVQEAMGIITVMGGYAHGSESGNIFVWGVDNSFEDTFGIELLHGRLINNEEKGNVVIVENTFAQKIYGRENIVGREISISIDGFYEKFEVIGVIKSQKSGIDAISGGMMPSFVYVSNEKLLSITGQNYIDQIMIKAYENETALCMSEVESFFSTKSEFIDSIKIQDMSSYVENISFVTFLVTAFIAAVASISLFVAMISVTGTMLSAANERRKEIGIYIALGISSKDIKKTFIFESGLICMFGGILGSVISMFIILIININFNVNIKFNILLPLSMLIICTLGGIIAGVSPAKKATKFDAIHSLRAE